MLRKGEKIMIKVTVNLNEICKLKTFVDEISKFDADFDAVRERYVIDAKSIMGMMSLNLSKPVDVIVHFKSDDECEIEAIKEILYRYQ